MWSTARRPIAICFFGITRSLRYTLPSIEEKVLAPARRLGRPKVYAHFFQQRAIDNPRSGETGRLDLEEHSLLHADWLRLEEPDSCLAQWDVEALKQYGDSWKDDFRSLRNLIHQLHSLDCVTRAALDDGADIALFCRPDLQYHDSLGGAIRRARRSTGLLAQVPYWQRWRGLNDRFAIVSGQAAMAAYGQRIRLAHTFCEEGSRALHSEGLVKFAVERAGVGVRTIGARASRIRMTGARVDEDFRHPRSKKIEKMYGVDLDRAIRFVARFY